MQVNRPEAKSQLSRLVKAALAGISAAQVEAAFSEAVDQEVGHPRPLSRR